MSSVGAAHQLLRYGDEPLWPTDHERVRRLGGGGGGGWSGAMRRANSAGRAPQPRDVPACVRCGAARRFELQLLPTLLAELQPRAARMPGFGSVFVYTCARNCATGDEYADEHCFVHSEI